MKAAVFWTQGRDDLLERLWHTDISLEDIAAQVGAHRDRVYQRATDYLGLGPRKKFRNPNNVCDARITRKNAEEQDIAFCNAMMRAIACGQETAPLGVDKRPCTKSPKLVRLGGHTRSPTGSPAASCIND